MEGLSPHHITVMFLSLGVLLGVARLLGELAHRFHQPAVLGELLAGVLLGPTVLGNVAPELTAFLFPASGPNAIALEGITTLAIVLFLLVAGIEVDLSTIWKQGKLGLRIGLGSMVVPFIAGLAGAWFLPQLFGRHAGAHTLTFALFLATALSISALPVIARTLMGIGLYRSDLGMVVISAAVFNDIVGWLIFAVILGMLDSGNHASNVAFTIVLTLIFTGAMLTAGRWLIDKSLPHVQAHTQWPAGVLGFALTLALLGAAFTEWIGVHAIFGAFLVGVAIGDSPHLRESTRVTVEHFISSIFAPLFFASIGLKVNFFAYFEPLLVASVLLIACATKLAGGYAGARWGGMTAREALAVGFAMNSRGAMEIILGMLALQAGIIQQPLFVALVIMAMVTSMMSGPGMRLILRHTKKRRLDELLSSGLYKRELQGHNRRAAIHELVILAGQAGSVDVHGAEEAVWAREGIMSTGIGNGVALPHARLPGITRPLVAVGVSDSGIDFDAPDGNPAHVIFLVLTPEEDPEVQLVLVAEIARIFSDPRLSDRVLRSRTFTDFLGLMRSASAELDSG